MSPEERTKLYHDVLSVDARGRALLEDLEHRFCSRPAVVTAGGIDAILQTYERAAQRAVLDYCHSQIARHSAQPTPEGEATWKP